MTTEVRFAESLPAGADALVVGLVADGDSARVAAPAGPELAGVDVAALSAGFAAVGATGKPEEISRIPGPDGFPLVVGVGLGSGPAGPTTETLRRAAGAAARALAGRGSAVLALPAASGDDVRAVAEGAALAGYVFTDYRHATRDSVRPPLSTATVVAASGQTADDAAERVRVVDEAVALARDLTNTPPSDLFPARFAELARERAEAFGLTVEVLDDDALRAGGYGGILGVGQGSSRPPRLVRVAYTGSAEPGGSRPKVALVGKGITFDSGGLSLKPPQSMETMKSDMAGAAAVLATAIAAARLELPVDVVSWLPLAENMPSGTAIRPSDVLTMYGGKRVEVLNTDAEGRLVLADALTRAAEESPDLIVDVATLTGAQIVALGNRVSAVMANDDALRDAVVAAGQRSGEAMWPMPLPPDLRKGLDSPIADLANMGDAKAGGGMLVAGLFLQEFVAPGVRWAHLDIAGPSFNTGEPWGYTPKGGTGVPVRTLLEVLSTLS